MLEERDHRGRDRDHLARRDVHVVDAVGGHEVDLATLAPDQHAVVGERAVALQRLVRLGDDVPVFLVRGQVVDLVADTLPAVDLAVRRLDEAERVDPRERRQGADQADVRAFRASRSGTSGRSATGARPDLEAGPLAGQTTRSERATAAAGGSGPPAGWSGP